MNKARDVCAFSREARNHRTIISAVLQRDVPQYNDQPWLITCVNARTISENSKSKPTPSYSEVQWVLCRSLYTMIGVAAFVQL